MQGMTAPALAVCNLFSPLFLFCSKDRYIFGNTSADDK